MQTLVWAFMVSVAHEMKNEERGRKSHVMWNMIFAYLKTIRTTNPSPQRHGEDRIDPEILSNTGHEVVQR